MHAYRHASGRRCELVRAEVKVGTKAIALDPEKGLPGTWLVTNEVEPLNFVRENRDVVVPVILHAYPEGNVTPERIAGRVKDILLVAHIEEHVAFAAIGEKVPGSCFVRFDPDVAPRALAWIFDRKAQYAIAKACCLRRRSTLIHGESGNSVADRQRERQGTCRNRAIGRIQRNENRSRGFTAGGRKTRDHSRLRIESKILRRQTGNAIGDGGTSIEETSEDVIGEVLTYYCLRTGRAQDARRRSLDAQRADRFREDECRPGLIP